LGGKVDNSRAVAVWKPEKGNAKGSPGRARKSSGTPRTLAVTADVRPVALSTPHDELEGLPDLVNPDQSPYVVYKTPTYQPSPGSYKLHDTPAGKKGKKKAKPKALQNLYEPVEAPGDGTAFRVTPDHKLQAKPKLPTSKSQPQIYTISGPRQEADQAKKPKAKKPTALIVGPPGSRRPSAEDMTPTDEISLHSMRRVDSMGYEMPSRLFNLRQIQAAPDLQHQAKLAAAMAKKGKKKSMLKGQKKQAAGVEPGYGALERAMDYQHVYDMIHLGRTGQRPVKQQQQQQQHQQNPALSYQNSAEDTQHDSHLSTHEEEYGQAALATAYHKHEDYDQAAFATTYHNHEDYEQAALATSRPNSQCMEQTTSYHNSEDYEQAALATSRNSSQGYKESASATTSHDGEDYEHAAFATSHHNSEDYGQAALATSKRTSEDYEKHTSEDYEQAFFASSYHNGQHAPSSAQKQRPTSTSSTKPFASWFSESPGGWGQDADLTRDYRATSDASSTYHPMWPARSPVTPNDWQRYQEMVSSLGISYVSEQHGFK
jgi:hypothetical protein